MIRDVNLKLTLQDRTLSFLEVKEYEEIGATLLVISQGTITNSFILEEKDKKELIKVLSST